MYLFKILDFQKYLFTKNYDYLTSIHSFKYSKYKLKKSFNKQSFSLIIIGNLMILSKKNEFYFVRN